MLPSERTITLKIKTLRYGQPRSYADSEYEYEIEADGMSEFDVKQYCTKVLKPCNQTREQWHTNDADSYFHGYYEFSKISENKYRYYKKEPFTD